MTQADNSKNARNEDMLDSVREVLSAIDDKKKESKDLNRIYKSIIYSIEWERNSLDDNGTVKVNFL
jgi:hypothetical protein